MEENPSTFAEKALARAAGLSYTIAGQFVNDPADAAISHRKIAGSVRSV